MNHKNSGHAAFSEPTETNPHSSEPWQSPQAPINGESPAAQGRSEQLPLFDNLIEEFLSPGQVARLLGVSVKTVYRWNAYGTLRGQRLGPRLIKFRRTEVPNLLSPIGKGEM